MGFRSVLERFAVAALRLFESRQAVLGSLPAGTRRKFAIARRVYCVSDQGAGFSMEHATRLFQAFRRLHSEQEFSGVGLGLATVQRIVTRYGGTIWAEAEANVGAKFFFTLPNAQLCELEREAPVLQKTYKTGLRSVSNT